MANLWSLACCHEFFSTLAKTKDLCSFILKSLVDICHWMGEFYYSSNSERGRDIVSLRNYSHCNATARLDTQWCRVSPYLWQQKHYTGLFKMIVGVLTTCHTQYTSDSSICIFLFNRPTLQVFVTYLTGALYVHSLWFYKHQHDNRVHSRLYVAC